MEPLTPPFREVVLETNERVNAIDYLSRVPRFLQEALNDDLMSWKWVFIALHQAVYSFAICAAKGTSPDTVQRKDGKLVDCYKALQMCQDPQWMSRVFMGQPLVLTATQKYALEMLKSTFRNNFEHFSPKLWFICLHPAPALVLECLEVVEFLVFKSNHVWELDESQRARVQADLDESRQLLRDSQLYREWSATGLPLIPEKTEKKTAKTQT